MTLMANHHDMPPHWRGHHARISGNRRRVRLACDRLESRDATGNVVSGVLSAALDGPLADSASELARLLGDWAFLGGARVYPPAPAVQESDEPPARKPANCKSRARRRPSSPPRTRSPSAGTT
jgi:hypothetical protein